MDTKNVKKRTHDPIKYEWQPSPTRLVKNILERKDIETLASHPRQRREVLAEPDVKHTKPELGRKPLVAIVGRPNVGKSTLFNRLVGQSKALITDTPGTTRDRVYGVCEWHDWQFIVADTGGMFGDSDPWSHDIHAQALAAISEADVIIYMLDYTANPAQSDKDLARVLRKQGITDAEQNDNNLARKPVILVMNKVDNPNRLEAVASMNTQRLGLGDPLTLSAAHGIGTIDLLDQITGLFPKLGFDKSANEDEETDSATRETKISIIGKPNVGKSSMLNSILGVQRAIVSPVEGTTSDPVDELVTWRGTPLTLIDTAGIRKRREDELEELSVLWALKVIDRSTLSMIVIDAMTGPSMADVKLASFVVARHRSAIIVVNKWDLAEQNGQVTKESYKEGVTSYFKYWPYIPIVFTSAKTNKNIPELVDLAVQISKERKAKVRSNELFTILQRAQLLQRAPHDGNREVKIKFITQISMSVPCFVIFATNVDLVNDVYQRYLENAIRKHYPFTGTPIRLLFKNAPKKMGFGKKKEKESDRKDRKPSDKKRKTKPSVKKNTKKSK